MKLESDITGSTLYFFEMEPLTVVDVPDNASVRFCLKDEPDGAILLDEQYFPDFDGKIKVDIRDAISEKMFLKLPEIGKEIIQEDSYHDFSLEIGDLTPFSFTVNGFSRKARQVMSDVDYLRIPRDYIIPVSLHNFSIRSGLVYDGAYDSIEQPDFISTTASGKGTVTRLVALSDSDALSLGNFQIRLECCSGAVLSPRYQICQGSFEQYLFANRYGGFDNIAMDGALEFAPETNYEAGLYNGVRERISAEARHIYSQNSGYVTTKVIEAMSELICSPQIYHYVNRVFRRIIITESSASVNSEGHLHSFSFKYTYADAIHPPQLRGTGSSADIIGHKSCAACLTVEIDNNPMVISHGLNRFPSVTVISSDKEKVECVVRYESKDVVSVSWNGELSGMIYLI